MDELVLVTQLADYYFALPALSKSLSEAMLREPLDLAQDAALGLELRSKLRNADLVRDCVCYLSGHWNIEPDLWSLEPNLRALVTRARQGILTTLGSAHNNLMTATMSNYSIRIPVSSIYLHIPSHYSLPQYYQAIHNLNTNANSPLYGDVSPLMANNLKLVGESVRPGQGNYSHYFLCGEVSDADLPWDPAQLDW